MRKNLSLANQLIATLPTQERGLFLANCELVELKLHEMVCLAGHVCEHVWFPVEGFVSIIFPVLGAAETAVAQVGSEGMFHISAAFDLKHSAFNCRVQAPGRAFRMTSATFQRHLSIGSCLRGALNRYMDARLCQLAQQTVCMHRHSVEKRLARALLMVRDRLCSKEIFLTHDVFAGMMGVRRESVTQAARSFQRRGLISYSRGYVMLLDVAALERIACVCYEADLHIYGRAFPEVELTDWGVSGEVINF